MGRHAGYSPGATETPHAVCETSAVPVVLHTWATIILRGLYKAPSHVTVVPSASGQCYAMSSNTAPYLPRIAWSSSSIGRLGLGPFRPLFGRFGTSRPARPGRLATSPRPYRSGAPKVPQLRTPGRTARNFGTLLSLFGCKVPILRTHGRTVRKNGTLGRSERRVLVGSQQRRAAKPPKVRVCWRYARKNGRFGSIIVRKHPKLRTWQRYPRTFGRFSPRGAGKHPKLRAFGGYARKPGGFVACCRPAAKWPKGA